MAYLASRNQNRIDIWPGFVDALATLLMMIIFLLMVFVVAQFFLGHALSGRDEALERLQGQVAELAELLNLERQANAVLSANTDKLSQKLQASLSAREDLSNSIIDLRMRAEAAEKLARTLKKNLDASLFSIETNKEMINDQLEKIVTLSDDIEALNALRAELENKIQNLLSKISNKENRLVTEKNLSKKALARIALLNKQIRALKEQLSQIGQVLEASEIKAIKQRIRIANLGKRLNAALATKVQELARYRSEFFGKLRDVLGSQPGIRIVGDRFVFQSEVLFGIGSDQLGEKGRKQIEQLAGTLKAISRKIPGDIAWILRVDGHTDQVPINTPRFPSNWELSTARAISVVQFLIRQGVSPTNLAATGFGEFQPIDPRDSKKAHIRNRRIELKLTQR